MRLIDADDMEYLEELEYEYHPEPNGEPWYRVKDVWDCIEKEHTVDPASLRPKGEWTECDWVKYDGHGECIHYPKEALRCSNCCNAFKKKLLWKRNFCPNCGADMRGETRDS